MAIIAFLMGSMLGTVCGLVGWLAFGMTLSAAIYLYFAIGLGFALTAILLNMLRPADPTSHIHAEI